MKQDLLSIKISLGSYNSIIQELLNLALSDMSSYVCVANVHMSIEAHNDPVFAEIVKNADLITPDGMPLAKAVNLLYGMEQDRVAGMDLLPDLLAKSQELEIPVYFYGGTQSMIDNTIKYCEEKYPFLKIAGHLSPPFRALTDVEENEIINNINASGAKFVFVALGCPKQEKWMASMKGKIMACMIGIGGALPVMIGMQKRAPKWMQTMSLEWFFRLMQEPKRLFKRYAITNTTFIYILFKQWAKQGFRAKKVVENIAR